MEESYVERIISAVERICELRGISSQSLRPRMGRRRLVGSTGPFIPNAFTPKEEVPEEALSAVASILNVPVSFIHLLADPSNNPLTRYLQDAVIRFLEKERDERAKERGE